MLLMRRQQGAQVAKLNGKKKSVIASRYRLLNASTNSRYSAQVGLIPANRPISDRILPIG